MMNKNQFIECREAYYRELVRQCFGPLPGDSEEDRRERLPFNPADYYITGMLFPKMTHADVDAAEEVEPPGDDVFEAAQEQRIEPRRGGDGGLEDPGEQTDESDLEPLNLANENCPSAMGFTFLVDGHARLTVDVSYGTYELEKTTKPHGLAGQQRKDGSYYPETYEHHDYLRSPHQHTKVIDVATDFSSRPTLELDLNDRVKLHFTKREEEKARVKISLMLVSTLESQGGKRVSYPSILFQTRLTVRSVDDAAVFHPISRPHTSMDDKERDSLGLLYRHHHAFGYGHGCAVIWDGVRGVEAEPRCGRLTTSYIPKFELTVIAPRESGRPVREEHRLEMSMAFLSGYGEADETRILQALRVFCRDYQAWIDDCQGESAKLPDHQLRVGERHLRTARQCLERMRGGISLLERNPRAMLAFKLANYAMWIQFHHSKLSRERKTKSPPAENYSDTRADWRPFQLGFLLMNLRAFAEPKHRDRQVVDLIWFPTGGGKTEAYLGLAAFAICLRRLLRRDNGGTQILMRYTLRLLTTQQFQRAATLIMALERMRRDQTMNADLGDEPISLGLWAGANLSPNKVHDALTKLKDFKNKGYKSYNVFQIMKCPWCGEPWDQHKNPGYRADLVDGRKVVVYSCPNHACYWHRVNAPIMVVDEDIYRRPPTLVLGTVDKFAQIAWKDEVGNLFGIGSDHDPPELIIQDELHLISGPLGTMVGLYEAAIDRLCSLKGKPPKIVASTATICHAEDQCKGLYGSRPTIQFPPQGLRAGDSYFALEDHQSPGRMYVGVFPSSARFMKDSQKSLATHLLQNLRSLTLAQADLRFAEVYGTLVWYFNSLRELGLAVGLCQGELPEYLHAIQHKKGLVVDERRGLREYVELTSRRSASEIPQVLQQMEIDWTPQPKKGRWPIDILLATNMIAVGVDISRLGLMLVNGQPKTTSEYIQASSRVGRGKQAPGMVVTLYNPAKNRDRSHFEQFVTYHQSLYRFVEPTSVTPYSGPARERGMRGILIGLARLAAGIRKPDQIETGLERLKQEIELFLERLQAIDPEESGDARAQIERWLKQWRAYQPKEYGVMFGRPKSLSLAYPAGQRPDPCFHNKRDAWPLLTSLRNVDGVCRAGVLTSFSEEEEA